MPVASPQQTSKKPRHAAVVRVTHWVTAAAFFALLVTGLEIVVSHPRFYWGEVGNVNTKPAFTLPIPASRDTVATGYHYVMPDENGWSRYLHFEAAWAALLAGLVYGIWGVWTGHFRKNLAPERGERGWAAVRRVLAGYWRRAPAGDGDRYNAVQRWVYLAVIFVLFPAMIWTGLAMSPAFTAAFPETASWLGGRQSARTLHFLLTWVLVGFVAVHITMISLAGFWSRMRAMITGRAGDGKERG